MRYFKAIPLLILFSLATFGCEGCGGTGTGNPTSVASGPANQTAAAAVRDAICSKLITCFTSLDSTTCTTGISTQTNIASTLGLAANFGSLQAIINAETAGTIQASSSVRTPCIADLNALACADTSVQASYATGSPADFSQVFHLIPTSCSTLY